MRDQDIATALQTLTGSADRDWQTAGQISLVETDLSDLIYEAQNALDALRSVKADMGRDDVNSALGEGFRFSHPGASGTLTSKAIRAESSVAVIRERIAANARIAELTKEI